MFGNNFKSRRTSFGQQIQQNIKHSLQVQNAKQKRKGGLKPPQQRIYSQCLIEDNNDQNNYLIAKKQQGKSAKTILSYRSAKSIYFEENQNKDINEKNNLGTSKSCKSIKSIQFNEKNQVFIYQKAKDAGKILSKKNIQVDEACCIIM